ncbi:hypothetical protein [Phaffia rhodozyma]|uniref:Uncharacterized protein n=1 Tax=Phaffia rhodozyma TaxID=264483 RepID=A0A0F7SPH1_PHARH|nr:hypothetical protein [Phaffia rhodozyma]
MPTAVPPTSNSLPSSRPVLRSNNSFSISSTHRPSLLPPAESEGLSVSQETTFPMGHTVTNKAPILRRNKSLTLPLGPTALLHRSLPPGPIPVRLQNSLYLQSSSSPFYQRAMHSRHTSVQSPSARVPVSQPSGHSGSYFNITTGPTSHQSSRRSRSSSFSSIVSSSSDSSIDSLSPSANSSTPSLASSVTSSEAEDQDFMIASVESISFSMELGPALDSQEKDTKGGEKVSSNVKKSSSRPLSFGSYSSRLSSVPASPPDELEESAVGESVLVDA